MKQHSYRQPNDTVTVDHSVLLTIARSAALSVKGVVRLGYAPGTIDRMLGRGASEKGLYLLIEEETVTVDVFLVMNANENLHKTSLKVQEEISRTMQQIAGMTVRAVNVHIEDVVFTSHD